MKKKDKRGGKRPGAGRKSNEYESKTLRVPVLLVEEFKKRIETFINNKEWKNKNWKKNEEEFEE